jgi:hypothetical protein
MSLSRSELTLKLKALEDAMPALLAAHPEDADFWPAFAGEAEAIEEAAAPEDFEFVRTQIDCVLGSHGLIPSDNEGEPCLPRPDAS